MGKGKWQHSVNCMGDSLTHNFSLSVPLHLLYPGQLQKKFQDAGNSTVVRNFGRSGNTTTQMLSRFSCMTQFGVPDIGVVFGGVNDPGNSIAQATTQANLENMIQTLKDAGCSKILVVSAQLLNYTNSGDIDASNQPKADTDCFYASVIAAQKAAAQSKGVVYCDLYNYLRNRIISGQDTAKSASWHVDVTNQHFNSYGCGLVAQLVFDTIKDQNWDSVFN